MGRPKALRRRDVVPESVHIETSTRMSTRSQGKHKKFGDEVDDVDDASEIIKSGEEQKITKSIPKKRTRNNDVAAVQPARAEVETSDDLDDQQPEEVAANSEEIRRLKELHDSMMSALVTKASRKKQRRDMPQKQQLGLEADRELSGDVFDAVADEGAEDDETENSEDDDVSADAMAIFKLRNEGKVGWHIDKQKKNSRKIENIEVTVLQPVQKGSLLSDPISSFTASESACAFSAETYSRNPRVKYASFATAKRGGPSKIFTTRRKN